MPLLPDIETTLRQRIKDKNPNIEVFYDREPSAVASKRSICVMAASEIEVAIVSTGPEYETIADINVWCASSKQHPKPAEARESAYELMRIVQSVVKDAQTDSLGFDEVYSIRLSEIEEIKGWLDKKKDRCVIMNGVVTIKALSNDVI